MRHRLCIAALALAATLLSGCAVVTDPSWTPAGFDDPLVLPASEAAMLDPATIDGIVPLRVRNDVVGVQARIALVPEAAAVNDRMLDVVRSAIASASTASGARYAPQAFPRGAGMGERACVRGSTALPAAELLADPLLGAPEGTGTALACDLVVASGTVFGQRVRVVAGSAAGITADSTATTYTDLATGEVVQASGLWSVDAAEQLWTGVVESLRREAGAMSLAPLDPPDAAALAAFAPALESTLPGVDGSLVFTIPPGFTAPVLESLGHAPTVEPRAFGVAPARTSGLVSPVGAALVAAASAGIPYEPPPAVPAGEQPADCALVPCVALTYDDGPSELTPSILDALAAQGGAATFFVLGDKVHASSELLRRMIAEGHQVENHTWSHPQLPDIPLARARAQIVDTSAAIEAVTGERVTMFRPPYGEYTSAIVDAAGLPAVLWDIDTLDWRGPADDELIRRAVDDPHPGSIVLQHDVHPNTARTAAAVYEGLADRGFQLVTVRQLFGGHPPTSGVWRSAR